LYLGYMSEVGDAEVALVNWRKVDILPDSTDSGIYGDCDGR